MASLQGQQINLTYEGLIKTADNTSTPPFPPVALQYGDGTDTPIKLGDGTSVGVGQITLIEGTPGVAGGGFLEVNGNGVGIGKLSNIDNAGATATILNGTFNFGAGFPGAPATSVDFTNATVTGLPSGAAGLESGTAANSMQSAASLTTIGAAATGTGSIVLGNNAADNGAQDVVIIGNGANTANNGDDYSVVIGKDAQSTVGNGIAIGQDAQSDGINTIMIGRGSAGTFNTIGIGITTTVNANEAIAIGYQADVQSGSNNGISIGVYSEVQGNNRDAIAIGQSTSARAEGAVALGDAVIAAKAQTVSVKALETQTNSTPTAGGIIMADAGGTERRLNITATGDLQIDSNAVGGGGAALHAMGGNLEGRTYYSSGASAEASTYRTWVNTTGYGMNLAAVFNRAAYALFTMVPGEDINKLAINVAQATAGATGEIAFYDTAVNADGFIYLNNRLTSLGTVDMSATGWKEVTLGTAYTVPTGLTNNTIAIVAFPSSTSANFGGWSGSMAMVGNGIYLTGGTPYRALHLHANPGVAPGTALPATIGDAGGSVDYKASTSNPLAVMIK